MTLAELKKYLSKGAVTASQVALLLSWDNLLKKLKMEVEK